jgi:O-antigen ligase
MSSKNAPQDWAAVVLALTLFLAPAVGVPAEEMLQDTLKSMVVSFGALGAALVFFWTRRASPEPLRWHALMWLPLLLMAYALGSMAWSHTFLAGVEAIRWFIFSLLLWLGLNTFTRERLPLLFTGIHWGAVMASLWVVLQFLVDFKLFAQGPNPASTFVNRNFFAEFVVCTVPFSVWLLANARGQDQIALRALFVAFNVVALMMTGTRSALVALVMLAVMIPLILYRYRAQFEFSAWGRKEQLLALVILLGTLVGLGSVPTGNAKILAEERGNNAIERTYFRVASFSAQDEFTTGSTSVRMVMWKATGRMMLDLPVTGVGAGAWEVEVPLYQVPGSQLETDFYTHNEFLQLLAEYGLVGWLFLLGLLAYLGTAAWKTWCPGSSASDATAVSVMQEGPIRALVLACLLAFLLVSGAGFPWRMASTGALFAMALAILAASDARLGTRLTTRLSTRLPWGPRLARASLAVTLLCVALAGYISQQAAACERKIITAVKIALTISASGEPRNPRWNDAKATMLRLTRESIAINPHYRKITPMLGDELARWSDWKNAIWVWESVVGSRPFVVAILANISRGYAFTGQADVARVYFARAKAIQADAPTVRSLEVILLGQSGQVVEAIRLTRQALKDGGYDYDMVNAAYSLGGQTGDWPLAIQGLTLRNKGWPAQAPEGWLRIGNIYWQEMKDEAQALQAYRAAVAAAPEVYRNAVRQKVPESLRGKL